MAAHRTACGKVMKFGTLIEGRLNSHHSKFGVSNSFPLAPPAVQICTHVYANNFWTTRARNKIPISSDSLAQDDSIAPYDVIFRHGNLSAILNFSKNLLFRTPHRPLLRFSRKLNQIIYRPCRQKVMEFKLIRLAIFEKTHKQILRSACENRRKAVSPQRFIGFRPNLAHVITSMTWGYMLRFGAAPPTGPEIWKMAIFAYNFWTFCPKIIKLVSLDSGQHAESTDIQFYHIGHFGCRPFWIMC